MLLRKGYVSVKNITFHPFSWSILRRFSEQSVVVAKKTSTSLKISKKPSRPPFMKNVFLGIFDKEMLVYPELEKNALEELKKRVEPYKEYFLNNIDPSAISALRIIPSEVRENLKNLGLYGQAVPAMYGGYEQTATETALISEVTAKDLNIALTLYTHNFIGTQTLVSHGSQQQKEKYLPRLASGEWISAFCATESNSGSDMASISAKVMISEDDPNVILLNGKKQWVINGTDANLFVVLAKVDYRKHTGEITEMCRTVLVEKDTPGVTIIPMEHLGLNVSNIAEVHFKDTPVEFIGGEFEGFEIVNKMLNNSRYNIGAITVSVLKNLMQKATKFIISRKQFDKQLIESELVQQKLADVAGCIYTLESMTYHTAAILDQYEDPDCALEQAIIKVFSFTEGRRCLDLILELLGGRAFLTSEITQNYFKDFRTMEVFDGTLDIAKLFISLTGLQYAGVTMNETVSKLRVPYEYPMFVLKSIFENRRQLSDDPKLDLQLYEQLHPTLTDAANELEYCVLRFKYAIKVFFNRYGPDVVNQQMELMRLTNVAVKIYAMTAILGRSSRSYCIGLPNAKSELKFAISICTAYKRSITFDLNDLIDGLVVSGDIYALKFGPDIFRHHGYFIGHPLERSY